MKIKRRPYLSWSQLNLWERDPNEYYLRYIEGVDFPTTRAMTLGKYVASELEKKVSKDKLIEQFRLLTPIVEYREKKFSANIDGINLFGVLDGFNEKNKEIIEYKTGASWNQTKVNNHGQLDFYATMYYILYKEIPKVKLIWFKTEKDENGDVYLTGDIKIYNRLVRLKDIIKTISRIKKADKEIQEMYNNINL